MVSVRVLTRGVSRGPVCKMSTWTSESLGPALLRAVIHMRVNDTLLTWTNNQILCGGSKKAAERNQTSAPARLWTVYHQKRVRTADKLPAHTGVSVCEWSVWSVWAECLWSIISLRAAWARLFYLPAILMLNPILNASSPLSAWRGFPCSPRQ